MAQGPLKTKPKLKNNHQSTTSSKITKKGSRTIAPKNAKLAKQAKVNKKLTGSLINDTEKMLGARAGHLEILGGGRRKGLGGDVGGVVKKGKKKGEGEKFRGKSNKTGVSAAAGKSEGLDG